MNKLTLLSVAVLSLVAGCNRPAVSTFPYDQMADEEFVAVVNGVGYTKGELERDVAITEKLLALSGLPSEDMVSRKDPKAFRRSVVNGFVAREVLLNEAKKRRVELSPADMDDFQDQFADSLSGRIPISFNALLDALGTRATAFRNNLKKDALSAKVEDLLKKQLAAKLPAPTPAELAKARSASFAANRQVELNNKALFRLATNAWKSIRAGNDFDVVGRKLPSLHKGILYEADCRTAADRFRNVAAGTLTAPVAIDGGLEVVKVSAAGGGKRISRLFFMPEIAQPQPTDEELAEVQSAKALAAHYAARLKELKQAAEISTAAL